MGNNLDRKEAYSIIKELNLQDEIKQKFGRNYTQVSNEDLWNYINEIVDIIDEKDVEEVYDEIKALAEAGVLTPDDLEAIAEMTAELAARIRIYS